MAPQRCDLNSECLSFWHGFQFRSASLEEEYNATYRQSLKRCSVLWGLLHLLGVAANLWYLDWEMGVAFHLCSAARPAIGIAMLAIVFLVPRTQNHLMILLNVSAILTVVCAVLQIQVQTPGLSRRILDVELLPIAQKLADDPSAMQMLEQYVHSTAALDVYTMQVIYYCMMVGVLVVYIGFSRSTLLMAVITAMCMASGAIVPVVAQAWARLAGGIVCVAASVALSVVMSRNRRYRFLVERHFESALESAVAASRKADSTLNHTLKNTMADADAEIEMFLQKCPSNEADLDHLRHTRECLQRGMRTCRHRQAYLQLAADQYALSLKAVNLRAFAGDHASGRRLQLRVEDLTVQLDVILCGLVLDNAISNAFKHGHPQEPGVTLETEVGDLTTASASELHGRRVRMAFVVRNQCNPARPKLTEQFIAAVLSGDRSVGPSESAMSDRIGLQQAFAAARLHAMEVSLVQIGDVVKFTAAMDVDVVRPPESVRHAVADPAADAAPFPPDLHIFCIDDSAAMRRLLASSLGARVGTSNVRVFGKDVGEVPQFIEQTLCDGDIAILDQHLEYGADANILGTDLVKELLEKGFKGLICMRSGNNADDDRKKYFAAGAHCSFGKDESLSRIAKAMKQSYVRHIGTADRPMGRAQAYIPSAAQSSASYPHASKVSAASQSSNRIIIESEQVDSPTCLPNTSSSVPLNAISSINLPMPQDPVEGRRSSSGGTAIWYTAFCRRAQCLPPTEEHLVRQCPYNPRKRSAAGGHPSSAKPKRDHRLETRRTVAKLLRQPYTVPRACMVIRALPVLTGDGLTGAETFLDAGMHLTPSVTPAKQWRPVTGATYVAASNLLQTAQSLIRGT